MGYTFRRYLNERSNRVQPAPEWIYFVMPLILPIIGEGFGIIQITVAKLVIAAVVYARYMEKWKEAETE
jgi:hypothetical protein